MCMYNSMYSNTSDLPGAQRDEGNRPDYDHYYYHYRSNANFNINISIIISSSMIMIDY